MKNKRVVLAIGRWMPIHLGHKSFLCRLAMEFDTLVIGIGSCYENGTARNCIPAAEREKLLLKILKTEGLSNVIIVPVQDRPTFEEWIDDVCSLCKIYGVTHFCTGNKEDILNVLEEKHIKLDLEMIDPEEDSDFPYHATDIRNAIMAGETEKLDSMIPAEIKPIVLRQVAKEIIEANRGNGQEFVPGRQTVDMVFCVKNRSDGKNYVLIGTRDGTKVDFPDTPAIPGGGILEFESPVAAVLRCFKAETGIEAVLLDNSDEPALISIASLDNMAAKMNFTGIYASRDTIINGTRGGGSQCFSIYIDGDIEEISKLFDPTHDLENLRFIDVNELYSVSLAFDQKRMVCHALDLLGIFYDNGENLQMFDEDGMPCGGVPRSIAHSEGVLHGASHIYIWKEENGKKYVLLQRRSMNKDSYPGCLDISSAGHIELGSDHLETAYKELFEELGIKAPCGSLEEVFTFRYSGENEFRGKRFIDNEVDKVYLLNLNVDISELTLQGSEVSEVIWQETDHVLNRVMLGDEEYCLVADEFSKVAEIIKGR